MANVVAEGIEQGAQRRFGQLAGETRGGEGSCPEMTNYLRQLRERQEAQAHTLADLTGWSLASIRSRIPAVTAPPEPKWYQRIWKR